MTFFITSSLKTNLSGHYCSSAVPECWRTVIPITAHRILRAWSFWLGNSS